MQISEEILNALPFERQLEISENVFRQDFTVSEKVRIATALEEQERRLAEKRKQSGKPAGNLPEGQGDVRDRLGKIVGLSGKSLEKAKTVVAAAKEDVKFQPVVEEMNRTGNIQSAFVQVCKEKKLEVRRKMAEEFRAADTDKVKLFNGDFREMEIADDSVDLIFTDPPYLKEYIPIYRDLGIFAKRVLKDGGSLLCYAGHYAIPEIINFLGENLKWHWLIVVHHSGPHKQMDGARVQVHYKPILWYSKGTVRQDRDYVQDHINSKKPEKIDHPWEQSTVEAEYFINHLSPPGGVVCDPFLGSGTTGQAAVQNNRVFIGAEIDEEHFKLAQMRILEAANVSHESA